MKKAVMKKLKSNAGESISEVLIASLVVSLAFVMVVSMVTASQKIIMKTDAAMDNYYEQRNNYEKGVADTSQATVIVSNSDGTFISQNVNVTVSTMNVVSNSTTTTFISYEATK